MMSATAPEVSQSGSVYICMSKNAYAFHKYKTCNGLQRCSKEIKKVSVAQAEKAGYRKCKICY